LNPLWAHLVNIWVWVLCYDRRSVGQCVLEQSTHLGLTTRFVLLLDSCRFVDVGRSLWQQDGSIIYNSCWSSPAQSFSGPSPVGLVTIFYCLRFETSLFAASYDSQGYGGGILTPINVFTISSAFWGEDYLTPLSVSRACSVG
jgi:hypothetical protein